MATGIPLPGQPGESFLKGIDTGSSMFSRMIAPMIERERLKQQQAQFEQDLALRKAAAGRASANADINRQILEQQLLGLKNKNNPNFLLQKLQEMSGGGGSTVTLANDLPSHIPSIGNKFNDAPQFSAMDLLIQGEGQGLMPLETENIQESIPKINTNAMGEMESNRPKNINGIPMEYIMQAITAKQLGLPVPKLGGATGGSYQGAAREALDMSRLKAQFGENSEEYRNAQAIQHAKEQNHADLSAIRSRQLNGLKPGDTEIKNPDTGEVLGFRKQLEAKERDAAKNTVLFNELYPLVYKGAYMFSGPGATAKLENAARNYKTSPEARKLIDDFLIAEKAATTTAVTEAARFSAGKTNQTFNRFVETLKAEDVNKRLKKWIKEYEVPASATLKAGMRWQKELNKAEHLANKRIPATRDYYFDPEKQASYETQKLINPENEGIETSSNAVIIIDPTGKRFETTEENANHLPAGWKRE